MEKQKENPFVRCSNCRSVLLRTTLKKQLYICERCDHHFPVPAYERVSQIVDPNSFIELFSEIKAVDLINFPDFDSLNKSIKFGSIDKKDIEVIPSLQEKTGKYREKLIAAKKRTGLNCAVLTGEASIRGRKFALAVFEYHFFAGTVGGAEGERLCRLFEHAVACELPVVVFLASGGMRMQEGLNSLMQMPKTIAGLSRIIGAKLPYCLVYCDPSYGGATASFGAVNYGLKIAEPGSRIGFSGPELARSIKPGEYKQLIKVQTAEVKTEQEQVDEVIHRRELSSFLARFLEQTDPKLLDALESDRERVFHSLDIEIEREKGGSSSPILVIPENCEQVCWPGDGIYYASPLPNEPPFVAVGDVVAEGQQLCIHEAMKCMSPIFAPCDGTIRAIFAQNEQRLEAGAVVFALEKCSS